MKVGLIGATGLVGQHALQQLLADEQIESVRVWARRQAPMADAKLDWQQLDFAQLADTADCQGLDVVLCALGTTQGKSGKQGLMTVDHDYVVAIAQAANAAQVPGFCVISALGASEKSPSYYSRVKAKTENALRALDFQSLEIIRPSLLMGEREESRPAEELGQKLAPLLNSLLCGPLKPYRAIAGADVAAAMLTLAKRAQAGQHVRLLPLAE